MARLLVTAYALVLLLCLCDQARSDGFDVGVDVRAVSSNTAESRYTGGLGKLRFDENHDGLQLGFLRAEYRADISPTLRFAAEAVSYGANDVNPVDLTEIYAEWRPIPTSIWRSRLKIGAFYPELSLENRMRGWRSPYTLSFSAINTWVGEELRTIGSQYSLDWLGFARGHNFEFSVSAAAFGWNDTAGTVIATRGWGLSDRQSTLFGRFANRGQSLEQRTLFYHDLDGRAGYYVSSSFRYSGIVELRAIHYDNRANLAATSTKIQDSAWATYFDSFGARWTPTDRATLVTQWLHGRTLVDTYLPQNAWSFSSAFLLGSWQSEPWRYSVRVDHFATQQTSSNFLAEVGYFLGDRGNALTIAVQRDFGPHWNAIVEGIQINSEVAQRAMLGIPLSDKERILQVALRYEH